MFESKYKLTVQQRIRRRRKGGHCNFRDKYIPKQNAFKYERKNKRQEQYKRT